MECSYMPTSFIWWPSWLYWPPVFGKAIGNILMVKTIKLTFRLGNDLLTKNCYKDTQYHKQGHMWSHVFVWNEFDQMFIPCYRPSYSRPCGYNVTCFKCLQVFHSKNLNVLSESINNTTTIPLQNPDEKEIGKLCDISFTSSMSWSSVKI